MTKSDLLSLRYELESLTIDFWYEVDMKGAARAASYYTDDAVFTSSVREYRGRAALETFYSRPRKPRVSLHVIHNFRIELETPLRARTWYLLSLYAADGTPILPSKPVVMLALVDEILLKQSDGSWLCESRLVQPQFRDDTQTTG